MSESKIELIAQLLAKAESTTPEEAEALTEAAEKLMVKHMIDQATIDARRAKGSAKAEKIVEVVVEFTGVYRGEMLHLGVSIANGLGTIKCLQHTGGSGKVFRLWLIGFESDVAQAQTLLASLQIQAVIAVRAFWKAAKEESFWLNSYEQEKQRRSFVHGFGTGVHQRLISSRAQVVAEASSGTELVLVSRSEKVGEYVADKYQTRQARARTATGRDGAARQGREAGLKANTGGTAVGQGRGISA